MVDGVSRFRHFGGFVLAGVAAMCVDAGILEMLTRGLGLSPFVGRPISIFVAMVVSWAINRWVAFAVTDPPSWREFGKFAVACTLSISVNYIVFAAILLAFPSTPFFVAIIFASLVSMFVSYTGFRFGAFRAASPPKPDR